MYQITLCAPKICAFCQPHLSKAGRKKLFKKALCPYFSYSITVSDGMWLLESCAAVSSLGLTLISPVLFWILWQILVIFLHLLSTCGVFGWSVTCLLFFFPSFIRSYSLICVFPFSQFCLLFSYCLLPPLTPEDLDTSRMMIWPLQQFLIWFSGPYF